MESSTEFKEKCKSRSHKKIRDLVDKMEAEVKNLINTRKKKVVHTLQNADYVLPVVLEKSDIKATKYYHTLIKGQKKYVEGDKTPSLELDNLLQIMKPRVFKSKIPCHPRIMKEVQKLVVVANELMQTSAMVRICVMTKVDEFMPSSDTVDAYRQLLWRLMAELDEVDKAARSAVEGWHAYFYLRPNLVDACVAFPDVPDVMESLKSRDVEIILDATTFMSETVKSYSTLSKVLLDTTDFMERSNRITQQCFNYFG